jgi:hypothetical protein
MWLLKSASSPALVPSSPLTPGLGFCPPYLEAALSSSRAPLLQFSACFLFFFLVAVLGFELRALRLLGRPSLT